MVAVKELLGVEVHKHLKKKDASSNLCCQRLGPRDVLRGHIPYRDQDDDNLFLILESCEEEC